MAYIEAWVSYAEEHELLFPKDVEDFDGYMIARFAVREVVSGRMQTGKTIVIKGKIISLHPGYRYLLRFKRAPKDDKEGYEILPEAGFRMAEPLPWTWSALRWTLKHELHSKSAEAAALGLLAAAGVGSVEELPTLTDELLATQPWYNEMQGRSDYYRMGAICKARDAWPGSLPAIRKLKPHELKALAEHLNEAPHELCYYAHSRHYGLGEMSYASLKQLRNPQTTTGVCMGAACFYDMLKQERLFQGHTVFVRDVWLDAFRRRHPQHPAEGSLQWLLRQGHVLPLDKDALYVERERWFEGNSPVYWLSFPRDDRLKERILGHLRRVFENFRLASGEFTPRDPNGEVVAAPRGPLNERQCEALRHVLNNPLTIVQGGPGSGKTAFGVEHLTCLFQNVAVHTHVGRQAVSLCDRLGGCLENASTIHGAHHQRLKPEGPLRVKYAERIEVLVLDEVYNADDATMEWALALAQNATRIVLVGDPDQILPIAGEEGAGTPALDIARAFPQHVVVLNENMRQLASARAIHEVVSCVRIKQPRAINWNAAPDALCRVDPPPHNTTQALVPIMEPLIRRLRQGIKGLADEHNWQIVTFYNGFKPEQQGLGVAQLNEIVENYLQRQAGGSHRGACKINNRLTMYPGFKFMINEKYKPHKSLRPAGLDKLKPAALGARRKKLAGGDGKTAYSETRNGQIEVVKSLHEVRLKGRKGGPIWVVECVPKGRCVQGAKLLLNRHLHVDPSGIVAAWAITSNKSMGGECKNVGVYIPPGIEQSYFDRSNIYVAFSRPMEYLGVVGRLRDIEALVMRDPRAVTTGLYLRLRDAGVRGPHQSPIGWDWKECHDHAFHGMLNEETLQRLGNIYDQSCRSPFPRPVPLCGVSWNWFLASEELDLASRPAARRELDHLVAQAYRKLYAGVPDHSPAVLARWEVVAPVHPEVAVVAVMDAEEPETKRPRLEEDDNDDEVLSASL
jgi:hypothetical protein